MYSEVSLILWKGSWQNKEIKIGDTTLKNYKSSALIRGQGICSGERAMSDSTQTTIKASIKILYG